MLEDTKIENSHQVAPYDMRFQKRSKIVLAWTVAKKTVKFWKRVGGLLLFLPDRRVQGGDEKIATIIVVNLYFSTKSFNNEI